MILALRALGVGDLATVVPALRALRAAYPGQTLALGAPRWLAPLVRLIDAVDRLVPVDGLAPRRWPPAGPDLAVNLHGRGPDSHRLLRSANPGRMLAFACAQADHPHGPRWRDDEHEVDRWCRLLAWYGIPADPGDLALRRPGGRHPRGLTLVHPGAKAEQRRWPPERFAAVARQLAARGHRVAVTGSAAERDLAERVAERAGLPRRAVLAGSTDTGQLAGLVAGGRLLISGDTGIAHLATAYGTPSVLLFGPMSPALWGPPADRPWHHVIWHGHLAGRAGEPHRAHPALRAITVGEVLAAVEQVESVAAVVGAGSGVRHARHAVAAR